MPHQSRNNLVLIGYRGVGKSTVGRLLADRLGRTFIDTDADIAHHAGRTIAEIFADEGEAAFRRRETEAIAAAAQRDSAVISVGGGALVHEPNVTALKATGLLIWLTAPAEILVRRLAEDSTQRPCLTALRPADEIRTLLAQREPAYRAAADWVLATDHVSPAAAAEAVAAWWRTQSAAS